MKRKNKNIKNMQPENVGAVHTHTHTHTHTDSLNKNKGAGEKTALKVMDKKRIIKWTMLVFLILALFCVSVIFINPTTRDGILGAIGGNLRNANTSNAVVSDATIISTKTGTGPFDSDDQPGNDSSENNNIVRSFDQVTWTVDLTMSSKDNKAIAGSKINVEATVPDTLTNLVKWDLESMSWMQNGQVSSDGRTVTGSYTVADTETSSSAKQTLVFILQVYGAGNETEIIPTFNFNIDGNSDDEKATTTGEKVIVSAKGKYNIKLVRNESMEKRALDLNYDGQSIDGRVYGYAFILQLYNDSPSKGLKGVEYPKGDITFDIDLKLERTKLGSTEREDITDGSVLLWNYKVNSDSEVIPDRSMDFGNRSTYNAFSYAPVGVCTSERNDCVYNSGKITMLQNENKLKVTINNYDFDGIFPKYNCEYNSSSAIEYTDNIGCFSVGYFQVIVPDNEKTMVEDRNYYLTLSDSNFNATSISDENVSNQIIKTDDDNTIIHVRYRPGSFTHHIYLWDVNWKMMQSSYSRGDSVGVINQKFIVASYVDISVNNDPDDKIQSMDRFFKFDGEAFDVIDYNSNKKFLILGLNNMTFKIWYVTKKDGSNWKDQTEMNNGKIEDMILYENKEDIPKGFVCIGIYAESQGGYIQSTQTDGGLLGIKLQIKENAKINKTYGFVQTTKYWKEALDRNIYSQEKLDSYNEYPIPIWDSGNQNYIKTEYDKNGNMVVGTHGGGYQYGQTILITGANLHGNIKAIDTSKVEKVNYDLGKNENRVTYSIEPQLDKNSNLSSQISNVTLKNEVTIPKGLEYIPGSSKRGDNSYTEPEITKNSDGSTTLVWYIYGVTSGQTITPITFEANIDNETANGTQYEAKYVVSELIGSDGISKIGNSEISFRTSTVSINIINLESHRLYKEVETPIIEKNGDITFKITYENKTETAVPNFQMLDILPYYGDNRGSNFNGTYTLKNINVIQTVGGSSQEIDNLKIYSTNSDNVKGMTAKDTGIGTDNIWESISNGDVNKSSKGIAIKGEVAGNTKIEVTVKLATNGNSAKDVYSNNVMAQVYSNSEQMQSSAVTARVVNRYIEGKVWQDSNTNGVIDDGEKYLSNITLKLINSSNNSEVATTTTNENGEYEFTDLSKGKYKVAIEVDGTYYYLTEKGVGTNVEINSKFNTDTAETDEITRLDSLQSPVLVEENVNAGLAINKIDVPVNKVWEDTSNAANKRPDGIIAVIKNGENEVGRQELNDGNDWRYTFSGLPKYTTDLQEINYTVEEQEKNDNDLKFYTSETTGNKAEGFTITNTFKVPDEKISVTVTKIWDDNNNQVGKRPDNVTLVLTGTGQGVNSSYEKELTAANKDPSNANNWVYTFNDLPKYDNYGNEITYTVDETNETDLSSHFYEKGNVDQSNKTVTNVSTYGKVTVHYYIIDENGDKTETKVPDINGEEIQDTIIEKAEGEGYETTPASNVKQNYELVEEETEGETQGIVNKYDEENPQIVTYYYLQNTKATVRYVARDPVTHEEIKDLEPPTTKEGLVGDEFITNSKYFLGYKLVESPNPTTIKMTKEEQTLIYWYEPVYTGLIENHIDDKTGKILYTEEHEVQVGQDYNIPSKNFEGYDLVESKLPNNASGTMGEELVTVNYYYIKKAVLEVNYIDKNTGEPLTDQIVDDTKHEGDSYTTEQKTFEDYDLVEVPLNKDGTLTVETDEYGNITNNKTVVTYYYVKKSAGVEEHHIDIITGKELEEPILHEGHVGAPYDIKSKDFLSYVVATTDKDGNNVLPTNAQGTMTEEKQVVTYYYYQPAKVIVHYVDRTTGKELEETNPETGELQSSQVIIEGQNQDDYTTTPKDFEYYKLVESPEEPNGKMKVEITKDENGKDVVNNTIDVYYYYEPKPFNIGVEKDISAIIVNGNRRNATNGKLEKVDIYRKSTENTSVQVEYKIKVMNTGEVEGRAIIEDKLPEGMTLANNDGTWEENGGVLRKVIPEIGAGETKEYTVLLNWKTSGNNMGNKVNEVALTETDNVPGFKDGNDKDNTDNATVSISVETGEFPVGLLVALVALVGLESVTLRYAVVLTKRQKKNNKNTPNK